MPDKRRFDHARRQAPTADIDLDTPVARSHGNARKCDSPTQCRRKTPTGNFAGSRRRHDTLVVTQDSLAFQARRTFALWTRIQVAPVEFLNALKEG